MPPPVYSSMVTLYGGPVVSRPVRAKSCLGVKITINITSHKNIASAGLCTLVSAGFISVLSRRPVNIRRSNIVGWTSFMTETHAGSIDRCCLHLVITACRLGRSMPTRPCIQCARTSFRIQPISRCVTN